MGLDIRNALIKGPVLVTGGCGFIGGAIVHALADEGRDVRVVSPLCHSFRSDVRFLNVDIRDLSALVRACQGCETVIHCASVVQTRNTARDEMWSVNYGGTVNVIEACRRAGVRKLVHISSASVVFEGRDIEAGDETLPYAEVSMSAYVDSKIEAERRVLEFATEGVTRACALRPHLVFGPGDQRFLPNILKRADGAGIREVGRREKLSDFVYIDNVVDAVLTAERALDSNGLVSGQAYFVTNAEPVPFFEFIERLLMASGYGPIRRRIPYWVAYAGAGIVEGFHAVIRRGLVPEDGLSRFAVRYLNTHHYFRIDKARRDLHWQPRVSLAEGIARTANSLHDSAYDRALRVQQEPSITKEPDDKGDVPR
ncbi:MAG: NAD-dependent epimerase/dehydratase family protein [Candidatus Dadabacteria bacterium]|nr:NAD-dependent epimerase/dehydratase family protein [Candidatus Dadabacteria bacterium]MYA48127.1 NAD-dependent epimerase/dehydratase family protein [Candidatus Dadabacteria bacterium]MYF47912.1 NAD-dependent epimerase/dehydratase family protein [Candidatus Dadabacteria bacterium]MYG83559.1 NAD-dependent epimerase/dehydratase family protein [Candidatus Dadabacteria bacterium]MYK49639.1 NAD-dependent epimerase/dehydratase family protein [Candidatus Dadabacteria bacterium]